MSRVSRCKRRNFDEEIFELRNFWLMQHGRLEKIVRSDELLDGLKRAIDEDERL